MTARVLFLDNETKPLVVHTWGLRDLNVGLNQIMEDAAVIGVGHRWAEQKRASYTSVWDLSAENDEDYNGVPYVGHGRMLKKLWGLLDEADVVVGWNSQGFDVPWLNGEFVKAGLTPPSPFKQVDLYRVARKNFRWPSYKLQYAAQVLLGSTKLSTGGHQLWVDCLKGDPKARKRMAAYCRRDVDLLPDLLEKLRPWMGAQVNFALYNGPEGAELACQKCGKADALRPKGTAYTATMAYPQYLCDTKRGGCGGWSRDKKSAFTTAGAGVQR